MPERPSATAPTAVDVRALRRDLEAAVDGEVRFDDGSRAAYATDASSFRQVPVAVVVPHTVDAAETAVAVCHRHRVPLRGDIAGQRLEADQRWAGGVRTHDLTDYERTRIDHPPPPSATTRTDPASTATLATTGDPISHHERQPR